MEIRSGKKGVLMKETIISARKQVKQFENTQILHGIDLELYAGDFTVIMGASGAGKSTLLYSLSGMDTAGGGELLYRGQTLSGAAETPCGRPAGADEAGRGKGQYEKLPHLRGRPQ